MTRRLDKPPHCKHKLVFRKEKYSATPDSLWRSEYSSAITGRVNEARMLSLQMIFSRVSTPPHRNRNACDMVSASETGFLPLARQPLPLPCHQPQSGCLLAAAARDGWRVFLTPGAPLQPLQSWINQSLKAFPGGGTREQAQACSSLCLKVMRCVFLL